MALPNITHRRVQVEDGTSLHVAEAGPANGLPVLLLHGFPDFWYTWKEQIPFLAGCGFRVIAPDQRGYNLSDKPTAVARYNMDRLAQDVVALMDACGLKSAALAGHDFGGSVAWRAAQLFPERITRLVILNVPHSAVLKRAIRTDWKQRTRSWYFFFFQVPWVPEFALRLFSFRRLAQTRQRCSRLSEADLGLYREAWAQPGAVKSMIQWYRALLQIRVRRLPSPRIHPPVLILWGARDPFLRRELAEISIELCDSGELVFLEEAAHWVHQDAPAEVNRLMAAFLGSAGFSLH